MFPCLMNKRTSHLGCSCGVFQLSYLHPTEIWEWLCIPCKASARIDFWKILNLLPIGCHF
uniref:Uncharacterized protein n=1 Tax=Rhizophora mucronata TaxID=61149 RepID=A0A2P2MNQ8_RHIMU